MPAANTAALPFVTQRHGGIDYWDAKETGIWGSDNAKGREYANALIESMRRAGAPIMLGHVASAMIAKQRFNGVETGFWQAVAEALI